MIDDEEIIAAIQEAPEEGETMSTPISYTIALDSIQNLFNYLEQNSDLQEICSTKLKESKMLL